MTDRQDSIEDDNPQEADSRTSSGVDPDENSSYPSDMVGSTNSTGHTVGLDVGETGSNVAETGSEEDIQRR